LVTGHKARGFFTPLKESSSSQKPVGFQQARFVAKKQTHSTPAAVVPTVNKVRGFFIPSEELLKKHPQCILLVSKKRSLTEVPAAQVPIVLERKDSCSSDVFAISGKSSTDDPPAKKGK